MFHSEREERAHPADVLGEALARASSVLSALTTCHDQGRGGFVVADQFVLQAVAAVEGFVSDARTAYLDMCNTCDLGVTAQALPDLVKQQAVQPDYPPVETAILPPLPMPVPVSEVQVQHHHAISPETRAASYDELMRKLTAAEVFAAERTASEPGRAANALGPLLKSLRADFEKIHAA